MESKKGKEKSLHKILQNRNHRWLSVPDRKQNKEQFLKKVDELGKCMSTYMEKKIYDYFDFAVFFAKICILHYLILQLKSK